MFCLDPIKEHEQAFNPIGCPCLYKSHGSCLQMWFEQKNQYECPICHTVSQLNPIQATHIQPTIMIIRQQDPYNSHQKCLGGCCLGLIVWVIIINLVNYLLGH